MRKHAYIPDTQIRPGVKLDHIKAAGRYLGAHLEPGDLLMLAGDWYDMHSLSSYDEPGSSGWEEKDLESDFESGEEGLSLLYHGFEETNPGLWDLLDKRVTLGNHEDRLRRIREMAMFRRFKGMLGDNRFHFKEFGFKVYKFLHFAIVDGIVYTHYLVNPESKMTNPVGGTIHNKLNKVKCSFTMGHQQGLDSGMQYLATGKRIRGLVAGSFYMHDEDYMGPQKNRQHWRGIVMKHEVRRGDYDLLEVSMRYLLEKWQ